MKCLRIEHSEAAAVVVKVPHNGGVGLALWVVGLPLVVGVGGDVKVLTVLDVLHKES